MNPTAHRLSKGAIVFGYPSSALRREASRGKLVLIRVGNRDYVTEAAIRDMEAQCEIRKSPQAYDCASVAAVPPQRASSTADDAVAAQAALRLKLKRRKLGSTLP